MLSSVEKMVNDGWRSLPVIRLFTSAGPSLQTSIFQNPEAEGTNLVSWLADGIGFTDWAERFDESSRAAAMSSPVRSLASDVSSAVESVGTVARFLPWILGLVLVVWLVSWLPQRG